MHILILSYYFPPYNTIGAIRVGKFARYLSEMGHQVHVVAARDPALEQNDASLAVEIAPERVTYTGWWTSTGFPEWPSVTYGGAVHLGSDTRPPTSSLLP